MVIELSGMQFVEVVFTRAYLFQIALEIMWSRVNNIHGKVRDGLS